MTAFLKRLHQMNDEDLRELAGAIDVELDRRQESLDPIPDSARRRANVRQRSYRRSSGASAPPIREVGLRETRRGHAA
jgi:hypothetical protein